MLYLDDKCGYDQWLGIGEINHVFEEYTMYIAGTCRFSVRSCSEWQQSFCKTRYEFPVKSPLSRFQKQPPSPSNILTFPQWQASAELKACPWRTKIPPFSAPVGVIVWPRTWRRKSLPCGDITKNWEEDVFFVRLYWDLRTAYPHNTRSCPS